MFGIIYNNHTPEDFGAWLATIPVLTHSTINRTRQAVPYRDGDLLVDDVSRSNAYWQCMIHLRQNDYLARIRQIRSWLSGEGLLQIHTGNNPDSFYEVVQVTQGEDIRADDTYGRITVSFEVYPYEFLESGETEIVSPSSISNPANMCKPVYIIEGSGNGTLTVNGNNMVLNSVSTKLTIDTRRQVAKNNQNQDANNTIKGLYEGLYLKNGNNSISITGGLTVKVIPHWGYNI